MSEYFFTEEGIKKARQEAESLERYIKVDIAKALATAAAHGDLRENAEYTAAKENQANSMAKLRRLQQRLTKARVVRESDFPPDTVTLCKRIKIKDLTADATDEYIILGEGEADLENGVISYQSPLANALIGHKVGDVVDARLPAGVRQFEILEIRFFGK
jgi:transcription elongation factor GreA